MSERDLIFELAQLHRDLGNMRRELCRLANSGAGDEWLQHASLLEESMRKTEAIIGAHGIPLTMAEKPAQERSEGTS